MKLNATKCNKPKQDKKNITYYNYSKKGHYQQEYYSLRKARNNKLQEVSTTEKAKEVGILKADTSYST